MKSACRAPPQPPPRASQTLRVAFSRAPPLPSASGKGRFHFSSRVICGVDDMLSVLTRSLRWIIPAPISHSFRMYVRHNGNTNRCKELATIHANVPVALLLVDEHLRVERVNRLAAQIAGQDAADLLEHRHGALGCLDALSDPSRCGNGPSCSECSFRLAILDTVLHGKRYESLEAWVPVDASPQPERRCLLVSTAPPGVQRTDESPGFRAGHHPAQAGRTRSAGRQGFVGS